MWNPNEKYLIIYLVIILILLLTINYLGYKKCVNPEHITNENFENVNNSEKQTPNVRNIQGVNATNTNSILQSNNFIITNEEDVLNKLIGSTFKLKVDVPNMQPFIKNKEYKQQENVPNYFYLAIEELDPNCSIQENNLKLDIYVDNKDCLNKGLSTQSRVNKYRYVLVPEEYALDMNMPKFQNTDFTLIKINDKLYLKNVKTKLIPRLFINDVLQTVYGNMLKDNISNLNTLVSNQNELWNQVNNAGSMPSPVTSEEVQKEFISCRRNLDGKLYFMVTDDLNTATPIKINITKVNETNYININLLTYNIYGMEDKKFNLSSCNFDLKKGEFIEKGSIDNISFFYNLVCIDSLENPQLKDKNLNFSIELTK